MDGLALETALNAKFAADGLGVTTSVQRLLAFPQAVVVAPSPPPLPPSLPPAPMSSESGGGGMAVIGAAAGVVVAVLILVLVLLKVKHRKVHAIRPSQDQW